MSTNQRLSDQDRRRLVRFGDELQRRRNEVGMSQGELGRLADVGWTRIRNWEQGLRRPTRSAVERLAAALIMARRMSLGLVGDRFRLMEDEWEELDERLCQLLGTTIGDRFAEDGRRFYAPAEPGSIIEDVLTMEDYERELAVSRFIHERCQQWAVREARKKARR